MKTKITLFFTFLFSLNLVLAQDQQQELIQELSIMTEYAKSKNYDAAYPSFMKFRKNNPKFSRAIYKYGEDILEGKIKASSGAEKTAFINDLIKLWQERAQYFPAKTPKGEYAAKASQLMYNNKATLGKSNTELYEAFDTAYKADKATFTNPKSLYTYFSLMVDLYDAGKKPAKDLFNKYDDVVEKVEDEVKNYSQNLNKLITKEDAGTALTSKDKKYKRYYESYLKNYALISKNIDAKLGKRANCENLIPLYTKDFEANKTNAIWLKRSVSRMFHKECTSDPLYEKLVKAYDQTEPSADTKYFVGTILMKKGKVNEGLSYFKQAYDLETDSFKKAKLASSKIGRALKRKGRYAEARSYYRKALKLNPSNGRPHLAIAAMYAASAKNCGSDGFNKRAVFWLAAQEARKASRVDPTLAKAAAQSATSYQAKAPSKQDIFNKGNAGQSIKIGCWIGSSVTVPNI